MCVFIAGAQTIGFEKSQALNIFQFFTFFPRISYLAIQVSKLSHCPFEILARVFALSGAIKNISAQARSSMCKTGSSRVFHFHSSRKLFVGFQTVKYFFQSTLRNKKRTILFSMNFGKSSPFDFWLYFKIFLFISSKITSVFSFLQIKS